MDTADSGVVGLFWFWCWKPSEAVNSGLSPARSRAVGSLAELILEVLGEHPAQLGAGLALSPLLICHLKRHAQSRRCCP